MPLRRNIFEIEPKMEGFEPLNLLYVEACPRKPGISRTRMLADVFLRAVQAAFPDTAVTRHDLSAMRLSPVDGDLLEKREARIDAGDWSHPLFAPARAFQAADAVVVAAPYWDFMFPAMLRVYIEHIFIREMTFRYQNDRCIGLCRAKRAVYLTTAGSPIDPLDFGTDYLRAAFAQLGILRLDAVRAEGLDLAGADVPRILKTAAHEAEALAKRFWP